MNLLLTIEININQAIMKSMKRSVETEGGGIIVETKEKKTNLKKIIIIIMFKKKINKTKQKK